MLTDCNVNIEYTVNAVSEVRLSDNSPVFFMKLKQKYENYNNAGRIKMQEFGTVKSTGEKAYLFTIENKKV